MTREEAQAKVAEVENLKFRLSMAESNNPDSVLSKHNAMLMACEARDKFQEELELCKVCLSDAEGMYELRANDLAALQAKVARAVALLREACDVDGLRRAELIDNALEVLR